MTDQFPDEYIEVLDAILSSVNNNPYALTEAMAKCENDKRTYEFYTFDSALAYYTYKKIKDTPGMKEPIDNLLKKLNDNLNKLGTQSNES